MSKQTRAHQPNQRADENISPQDIGGGPQHGVAVEGSQLDDVDDAPDPELLSGEDDDDDTADDDPEGAGDTASVI